MDKLAKRDANILIALFNGIIARFYQVFVEVLEKDKYDRGVQWKITQELPVL